MGCTALLLAGTALATYGGPATVTAYSGNPSCSDLGYPNSLKVDTADTGGEYPPSGTYTSGSLSVTITVYPNTDPISFDFTANHLVQAVLVKAGSGGLRYTYTTAVTSDNGLESPVDDAISHIEFCSGAPSAVTLQSLAAQRTARGVLVVWRTAAAPGTAGYNLYRQLAGKRVRLNRTLIPAATGLRSHAYRWLDRSAPSTRARYWLQDVSTSGVRTWHGPASAS